MKRVRTAIITAGMAAVLGGCSQVTSLLDETVATEPLETEEYTEAGPQLEPSETINRGHRYSLFSRGPDG